jgi:hypothetical protein
MRSSTNSSPKSKQTHQVWHVLLLVAGLLALSALIFDDAFVKRWFTAYQQLSEKRQYYLDFFRLGLFVIAGGCIVLWSLRKIISDDWRAAVLRWGDISPRIKASAIMPVIHFSGIKVFLWLFLPIWMIGVIISLIPGYETWASRLTEEKGVFETFTVICYLFSGPAALYLVLTCFKRNALMGLRRWWLLGLAFGCLFIAGEEINWGALYFHYEVGGLIRQINAQNDVSLHNIPLPFIGTSWANDLSQLIAVCGGILLPFLIWVSNLFRRLMVVCEAPLPPWISQAYFFVAAIIPQDGLIKLQRANIPSELREITIAMGVTIWLYCMLENQLKVKR